MTKSSTLGLVLLILSQVTFSWTQIKRELDSSNMREGEKVEFCIQHKKMAEYLKNEEYAKMYEQDKKVFQKTLNKGVQKGTIYRIPIVFHVLHNGGIENISDEQIYNQVEILNRDFRLQNADASTVQTVFQGLPTDAEIEFVLATKAPNGSCFKGITRTKNPITTNGSNGDDQVTAIRNGNDVFKGNWAGNRYLNVFVVVDADGAAGYTNNPASWSAFSMTNGIWIKHDYVGSIGTSIPLKSRTLTHEVGHWLNLSHTWGPNNNPGNSESCSTDDGVNDTPNCIGVTSCNFLSNSCIDNINDKIDNVENYMDYSYCTKMFTAGQVARMRAALQVTSSGRFNIWQQANLNFTGATGVLVLCAAEFSADRTSICIGEQIKLKDESYNSAKNWNWEIIPSSGWIFSSGSLATDQNPSILFNESGYYTIKLTVSDGSNSLTTTKTDFIRVSPNSTIIPYWEGFENYTSLTKLNNWEVFNPDNNNSWILESSTANSGTNCIKLINFGQSVGSVDEITSAAIDLSNIPKSSSVTLSFRYSYRKKTSSDVEYLKIFLSGDCGKNWGNPRRTLGGSQLSPLTSSTSWKPSQLSDWTTVHVNVSNFFYNENLKMKFQFESGGGNNIYLDDINLYQGAPTNDLVVGLNEHDPNYSINNLDVYPNPTDDELNVQFNLNRTEMLEFEITDLTGKPLQKLVLKGNYGENMLLLETKNLNSGLYLLRVRCGKTSKTIQFIKN